MTSRHETLAEIRASIADGATLDRVDSTDDRLLLVLDDGTGTQGFRLDPDETRHLLGTDVFEGLAAPPAGREALVPS